MAPRLRSMRSCFFLEKRFSICPAMPFSGSRKKALQHAQGDDVLGQRVADLHAGQLVERDLDPGLAAQDFDGQVLAGLVVRVADDHGVLGQADLLAEALVVRPAVAEQDLGLLPDAQQGLRGEADLAGRLAAPDLRAEALQQETMQPFRRRGLHDDLAGADHAVATGTHDGQGQITAFHSRILLLWIAPSCPAPCSKQARLTGAGRWTHPPGRPGAATTNRRAGSGRRGR
jgi:hypothetical protein